jgi:deoxycytidylate deaminase
MELFIPNTFGETKHYAAFFPYKSTTIIVSGFNMPIKKYGRPSIHAEHNALLKLLKLRERPKVVDLISIRISKGGELGESRPCINCIEKLQKSGIDIRNIFYSTNNKEIICMKFRYIQISELHVASGFTKKWHRS